MKNIKPIEVTIHVNRCHEEFVEDDDYFINTILVEGEELENLEELTDKVEVSLEEMWTAEDLQDLHDTEFLDKEGKKYRIEVVDDNEDEVEEYLNSDEDDY